MLFYRCDIAIAAGVSMITGFYVVNDELGSFTKETQRRVIRAIEEALDAGDCCLSIGTLKG